MGVGLLIDGTKDYDFIFNDIAVFHHVAVRDREEIGMRIFNVTLLGRLLSGLHTRITSYCQIRQRVDGGAYKMLVLRVFAYTSIALS